MMESIARETGVGLFGISQTAGIESIRGIVSEVF